MGLLLSDHHVRPKEVHLTSKMAAMGRSTTRAMDGTRVKISGFILPASAFKQTGLDRFVLIRDNQECCFGPGAYIYHNIQVEMEEGKGADFSDLPVQVEGEMRIKPWFGPDDKCYSVYHMTANRVSR